jgi:hypothetical protein
LVQAQKSLLKQAASQRKVLLSTAPLQTLHSTGWDSDTNAITAKLLPSQ